VIPTRKLDNMATGELTPAVQIIIEGPTMSMDVDAAVPDVAMVSQWLREPVCRNKRVNSWSVSPSMWS